MNKLNLLPESNEPSRGRFPSWLHRKIPSGGEYFKTGAILETYGLNTVCEEAKCPNRMECYSKKTATFLALGKQCTRNCGFCDIDFSKTPLPPEENEPRNIALSVRDLGLKHVVITMVARDDLPDGGSFHMGQIIDAIRSENPLCSIEILTSDFNGNLEALSALLSKKPEIFNHNIETVSRLSPKVRHKASYERTLEILSHAKKKTQESLIKSGIMVGLGETPDEVKQTIQDLVNVGCDIITIGHYLQANIKKLLVKEFITPLQFEEYRLFGESLGAHMYSGPFVRSSYNASDVFSHIKEKKQI